MTNVTTKSVVMIGGFGHEGLNANLKALGYDLVSLKLEDVLPRTWEKRLGVIETLKDSGRLSACIIYLHTSLLLRASKDRYREVFLQILATTRSAKTIIFVYQDNLDGIFSMRDPQSGAPMTLDRLEANLNNDNSEDSWMNRFRYEGAISRLRDYQSRTEQVNAVLNALYESGAEVCPFLIRSDVTIRLQEFLTDLDGGVFLRLFVPSDRLQSEQLKSLLGVLERYLRQVEGRSFSIDSRKSEKGVAYIFRSTSGSDSLQTLDEAFARFDDFMKLCGDDAAKAESLLKNKGLPAEEASFAVEKYAREYRRLILDTKHEFERKTLVLRQRLEVEVTETGLTPTLSWSQETLPSLVTAAATGANIVINIGTVSVVNADKVHTQVEQLINGSVTYNSDDKHLMELFTLYADRLEALQCRSDLDQLKDKSAPEPTRQTAKQRLVGFLRKAAYKSGEVVEKVAVTALSKYLESLFKGS